MFTVTIFLTNSRGRYDLQSCRCRYSILTTGWTWALNKIKYCNMFTQTSLQNKTSWYFYADTSTKHGMPIDFCFPSSFRPDLNMVRARCWLSEICERSLIQYLDYITVSNMNLWDCIAFMSGYCSFCSRSLITVPRILYIATLGQTVQIGLTLLPQSLTWYCWRNLFIWKSVKCSLWGLGWNWWIEAHVNISVQMIPINTTGSVAYNCINTIGDILRNLSSLFSRMFKFHSSIFLLLLSGKTSQQNTIWLHVYNKSRNVPRGKYISQHVHPGRNSLILATSLRCLYCGQ